VKSPVNTGGVSTNSGLGAGSLAGSCALVADEKEQLVLLDRTAQDPAELVALKPGDLFAGRPASPQSLCFE